MAIASSMVLDNLESSYSMPLSNSGGVKRTRAPDEDHYTPEHRSKPQPRPAPLELDESIVAMYDPPQSYQLPS